jgi:hypothetical protein
MLRFFIALLFSGYVGISFAQEELSELEKRNGFKDIKLGMPVDSVKGLKFKKDFKEKEEFDAKLYEVEHPSYAKIGEVNVKSIELKAYKNLIYEISVITEKDPRLMKALESIYGKADYDMKKETYFWRGQTLVLQFRSPSKHQLEMLYGSITVRNLMKTDKAKKVEAIADDF